MFIAFARPFARTGNFPIFTSKPCVARLRLGQADARDLRLAVRRARHLAVVRGRATSWPASRSTTITPIADATCARFMMPVTSPIA